MAGPFDNSAQIGPNALNGVSAAPYQAQISPAIQALNDAFEKGLVKASDLANAGLAPHLRQAAAAKADKETAQAKADQGLIPKATALQGAQLNAGLQILPKSTQATLGDLGTKIAVQPAQQQIAVNTTQGEVPESNLISSEAKQDPQGTLGLTKTRHAYESFFGVPAKDDKGNLDYDNMAQTVQGVRRNLIQGQVTPQQKEILETLKSYGPSALAQAYNPNGTLKTYAELQDVMSKATPSPNAEQTQTAANRLPAFSEALRGLQTANGIVNSSEHEFVGPGAGQGSWLGKGLASATAFLGFDPSKEQGQRNLQRALAGNILGAIRSLAGTGQIRNTELQKIEESQPKLSDTKDAWNKWLADTQQTIQDAYQVNQKVASKGALPTPQGVPQAASLPAGVPASDMTLQARLLKNIGAAKVPPDKAASMKHVTTQADYNALPPGAYYYNDAGEIGVKK